ncbi:hypothetical protein Tco_0698279 [Tanacetum coccineum]
MASLDHRLNPLFAIKECSSCGALYTADFCCSKGGFVDKILVPKPPQNCPTRNCGDTVHLKSHSSSIKTPVKIPRKVLHKLTTIVVTSVGNNALDELLQTLPSVHPTCNSGNENSFTYDSKPNFVDDSPNCQPMNQDFYHSNLSGFDQFQPPQFPINYPPQETSKEILQAQDDLMEAIQACLKEYDHIPPNEKFMALLLAEERFLKIKQAMEEEHNQPGLGKVLAKIKDALTDKQYQQDDIQELMSKLLEDVQNIREELYEYINCPSWNHPTFYDNDDDEYTIIYSKPKAITPILPIEEPDNSLSMEDKHLDTIPSVENLVPILSELEGIPDDTCDVPVCDDSSTFDALSNHSEILSDSKNDDTSSDDDSYENIEYVEASPLNLEYDSLEEVEPDQGGLISIVISDNSKDPLLELPEFESFHFDLYDDPSFPRPTPEPPDVEISLIVETDAPVMNNFDELNEDECFDPGGDEIDVEDDNSFTFVIRTFLSFLTYLADSPLLLFTRSEDTIFEPGIST